MRCKSKKSNIIIFATIVLIMLQFVSIASASYTADVTLTITRFKEIQCPDNTGCPGDYYAKVFIDGHEQRTAGEIESADFSPDNWIFTQSVDATSRDTIPIDIQIWDSDIGIDPNGDDLMDISNGDDTLHLTMDLATGRLTGDSDVAPDTLGESHGSPGGSPVGQIFFKAFSSLERDADEDGIPDGIELKGAWDDSHTVFTDLPGMGADPCRKSIDIEIDYMETPGLDHTHRPKPEAITEIKDAFDKAPVPAKTECRYPGFPTKARGINMIIDIDSPINTIPEKEVLGLDSDYAKVRQDSFTPGRRPWFHYAIFAHDQKKDESSSGLCCLDDKDFLITLGHWDGQVGTIRDQAGSIMHELGHSLGLGHGGDSGTNYKPNYFSVMNYAFDPGGIPDKATGKSTLDYSQSILSNLAEKTLSESAGIGDSTFVTTWTDSNGATFGGVGNGPLDWNGNGVIDAGTVNVDINRDSLCVGPGKNGMLGTIPANDDFAVFGGISNGPDHICDSTSVGDDVQVTPVGQAEPGPLSGYEDWSKIIYRGAKASGAGAPSVNHGPDITYEEARANQLVFSDPDLKVTKIVDKLEAAPGDTLTYTVTIENIGKGVADEVVMSDTKPDGSVVTQPMSDVSPGGSVTQTFTYTVPCTATDGTIVTNSASVSSKNLLGTPEVNTANNAATVTTTVRTPVLTMTKTATASVNAAEAITYRIIYQNIGSGTAKKVLVKDVLPAGIYYSKSLDLGAGPKPTTVVLNTDGSHTLTWELGDIIGNSGSQIIEYTARSSLLALEGVTFTNAATLDYQSAGGCTYPTLNGQATTRITIVSPTKDPTTLGFWKNHRELWTTEILARIQATDQRYDTNGNGALSTDEATEMFASGGNQPNILKTQLLATYMNLATRRINAGTHISSRTADRLGLNNVADASIYAMNTLKLPVISANSVRYDDATRVLDEINSNKNEVY